MGYNIYITRAEVPYENGDYQITLKEWQDLIHKDSELESIDKLEIILPNGMTLSQDNEGMAVWEYKIQNEKQKIYFHYSEGNILTEYSDALIIKKMNKIANELNAKVIGEEGEAY